MRSQKQAAFSPHGVRPRGVHRPPTHWFNLTPDAERLSSTEEVAVRGCGVWCGWRMSAKRQKISLVVTSAGARPFILLP